MISKIHKEGLIFVISGPSGSGKTTLRDKVLQNAVFKNGFVKSISFTTRPKRPTEREGKDYVFIAEEDFRRLLKNNKILEWTRYLGYYYATSKDFVAEKLAAGKNIILCLDLKGASVVKKLFPQNTVTIFIKPPSFEELHIRINSRCSKTKKEEIAKRLRLAKKEMLAAPGYDYSLVNKNLEQALGTLQGIILRETAIRQKGAK